MATKPLVYVLHGAWHGPSYFETVKAKLHALGYTMACPEQPSTGASPPTKTLYDDAAYVRAELELLIEHGQEVVLVMHSYGGMVGTQAAAGLGKAERTQRGLSGGIVRLFYACAFLLPVGSDLCKSLGGSFPPWIKEEVRQMVVPAGRPKASANQFLLSRLTAVATRSGLNTCSTTTYPLRSRSIGLES